MIIKKQSIRSLNWKHPIIEEALRENYLASGPHVEEFESGLKKEFGFDHCISLTNGYSALFVALKALSIRDGYIIVPSASTCLAMTNAVLATGNTPVFCPLDRENYGLNLHALKKLLNENKIQAIIAPSHFGIAAPIAKIKDLTDVPVIEDACQAFYTRTLIQSEADIVVLSFYPTKMFNCIDGGCLLTNNTGIAKRSQEFRYYDDQYKSNGSERFNLKMNNLNCAIGLVELEKIVSTRRRLLEVKEIYVSNLGRISKIFCETQLEDNVVPWRLIVQLNNPSWYPNIPKTIQIERELIDASINQQDSPFPSILENTYAIPFHHELSEENIDHILNGLEYACS